MESRFFFWRGTFAKKLAAIWPLVKGRVGQRIFWGVRPIFRGEVLVLGSVCEIWLLMLIATQLLVSLPILQIWLLIYSCIYLCVFALKYELLPRPCTQKQSELWLFAVEWRQLLGVVNKNPTNIRWASIPGRWLFATHLKNMRKSNWIISSRFEVKIKNMWNHYLDAVSLSPIESSQWWRGASTSQTIQLDFLEAGGIFSLHNPWSLSYQKTKNIFVPGTCNIHLFNGCFNWMNQIFTWHTVVSPNIH